MSGCPNCGGRQWLRRRSVRLHKDALRCMACGYDCEAPSTYLAWVTAIAAALAVALTSSETSEFIEGDYRQA